MRNRKDEAARALIVAEARRHVGYRAQPDRKSAFQLAGYLGKPWNGTFVDRVIHDSIGTPFGEVRFLSTVTALAYYVKRNRVYQKPRTGDVVFFNFSTDTQQPFEQPHVGIVIELLKNGAIRTVEAEVSPGTPQGSQLPDGVFERVRYPTDVIGYVRPKGQTVTDPEDGAPVLKMSYFDSNPKTKARAVSTVQRALHKATGQSFSEGKLNGETKSAFGLYARERGSVSNRGEFEHVPLTNLSDFTGEFTLE